MYAFKILITYQLQFHLNNIIIDVYILKMSYHMSDFSLIIV